MTNQQLKAHCEDVIANPQDHPDWVVDMARVALEGLRAKAKFQIRSTNRADWIDIDTKSLAVHHRDNMGYEMREYFIAPPVLEMKSSRIKKVAEEIVENLVDCGPADVEAVEQYTAWVIQRLNGVKS